MNKKILVIAAHPDDEVLGLGGTLLAHRDADDKISILILGNGEDSRDTGADPKKRLAQAESIKKILKSDLYTENFPDNAFDTVALLLVAKAVEKIVAKVKPDIIYTHHSNDLNIDHRIAFQATLTACRPQPGFCVKEILTFETLSSTEWQKKGQEQFTPQYYRDISKHIEEKLKLMEVYKDELRDYPHPRSLEGVKVLAKFRGMEVGLNYAEAFEAVRIINSQK